MPKLTLENGPRAGTEFAFDKEMVVGRGRVVDLTVDDPSVSRRHAMLKWRDNQCVIADLGSANGTFINGRQVLQPARVRNGDVLAFGGIRARFTQDAPHAAPPADPALPAVVETADEQRVMLSVPAEGLETTQIAADPAIDANTMVQRLRFLSDLGKISGRAFDQRALMSFVLDEMLVLFPRAERAFVFLWEAAVDGLIPAGARMSRGPAAGGAVSRTLLKEAIERREAILVGDAQVDQRLAQAESIRLGRMRSAICAPMIFDNEVYGVVQIDSERTAMPFGRDDVSLLAGIASHIGMAVGFARLHAALVERELVERDLALAKKIQRHFLPQQTPRPPGYEFAVEYTPALSVGGDFFDFLALGEGIVGIAVGDVSGKGVSAALYAAKVGSELRHHALGQTEPRAILERLNASLSETESEGMFVTLLLATLDTQSHRLTVANAGHTLPLLRPAGAEIVELGRGGNLPLGLADRTSLDQTVHQMNPGSSILFFTDGVTEAMNDRQDLFGVERLTSSFARAGQGAEHAIQAIKAAVSGFVGTAAQSDDITLVTVARAATTS